jgi:sulfur-oxidizing protein SoxZ
MMVARVQMPQQARRGEVFEIRIAVQHVMETGYRYDNRGQPIPKNVINTLIARYNGAEFFRARFWHRGQPLFSVLCEGRGER